MKEKINQYLRKIETERNIKILLACETGSRAWGFPSPDSDYDIRLIYVHKRDWYLSLSEEKDSIEMMLDNNEIDITGWDLRKALRLLQKSNPPLLERIQSAIIYNCDPNFLTEIYEFAKLHYSRIATIHHYLSITKKKLSEIKEKDKYKLKSFFYALRSATVCKWILEKEEIPPIEFQEVISGIKLNNHLKLRINELISLKSTINESYYHQGENELIAFIENLISEAEEKGKSLPASKGKLENLNIFFRKTLLINDN